jgi:hypothetical protein
MNGPLAFLVILGAVLGGLVAWSALRPDPVGKRVRQRASQGGLQGRLDEWLYWEAPLASIRIKDPKILQQINTTNPWLRSIQSLVRRVSVEDNVDENEAFARLKKRAKTPIAQAYLRGELGRATRLHWRSRYRGRPSLFWPWYYGVALVRHGRRHMILETMSTALQELRTT